LAADHPFRKASEALLFFSHGAVDLEDTTIERHAVAIGNAVPPSGTGASGQVRWGMLQLDDDGRWAVDHDAVDAFAACTVERVLAHEAVLDRVASWREQLGYLWTWLVPTADLGPAHLDAVGSAIARFEDAFEGGVREFVRADVARRFLGERPGELPDAWLHWPLTAGGLGLPYPAADRVPLAMTRAAKEPPPLPEPVGEPSNDPTWGAWYATLLQPLEPMPPADAEDPSIQHFVERGTRLGRADVALAPHWRWGLHTLGPDILDAYGSYDFIATDLVPVDLIRGSARG
jgi:hypothetical protein